MTKFKDIIFEPNVAIHCPEEWMADELIEYADSKGYEWCISRKYTDGNEWNTQEQNTVYFIEQIPYSGINCAEKKYTILHYNDVVIKEGNEMETKLDYELIIKGRKAMIGDKIWLKLSTGITSVIIDEILIYNAYSSRITLINENREKTVFQLTNLDFIKSHLFWEKPIIYQLPDTNGKLSEVKIGQKVWFMSDWCLIDEMDSESKEILLIHPSMGIKRVNNNTGKYNNIYYARTNKPHRYFSGCMDWSHAPKDAVEWRVTVDGYAFWYSNAYCERSGLDYDYDCGMYYISAGYRADLLNENGVVEDWEYSLVKRPEGK